MMHTGSHVRLVATISRRWAVRVARPLLSLVFVTSTLVIAPVSTTAAPLPPPTGQFTWDTQADFETNAGTTGQATTRRNVSTADSPDSVIVSLPDQPAVAIAAGSNHAIALSSNGRASSSGWWPGGAISGIAAWSDLVAVAGGAEHSVGLKSDGSVVTVGGNTEGQRNVGAWADMTSIGAGTFHTVGVTSDGAALAVGRNTDGQCNVGSWTNVVSVDGGESHTIGLRADGTAVATGYNGWGQCNVGGWTGIDKVSAGWNHTIGLRQDGTVAAVGNNGSGQTNVGAWTGVVDVAGGWRHTVAARSDGTVYATGDNSGGQCNVAGWTDVVAVAAGYNVTLGLKSNGDVVSTGGPSDPYGIKGQAFSEIAALSAGEFATILIKTNDTIEVQSSFQDKTEMYAWTDVTKAVGGNDHYVGLKSDGTVLHGGGDGGVGLNGVTAWTDIVDVGVGQMHTVGVKNDGTAVAVGRNTAGQCNVAGWSNILAADGGQHYSVGLRSDGTIAYTGSPSWNVFGAWTDIVQIDSGYYHALGLKSDGSVVANGAVYMTHGELDVASWGDIVQVAAGNGHSVGLKSDGTVVATGDNTSGQCNVSGWTDIVAIAAGFSHTAALRSDGRVLTTGANNMFQSDTDKIVYLNHGPGGIGGRGGDVGLRAQAPASFHNWSALSAEVVADPRGGAVKFAVRVSDDGVSWSAPMGRDGAPIDWTNESGNYFGSGNTDTEWYGDLSQIPAKPYIDVVARLEQNRISWPEINSVTVEYANNQPPVAVEDSAACDEDTSATLNVLANDTDPEGDAGI